MRNNIFLMDPFQSLVEEFDSFFPINFETKSVYPYVNIKETEEEVKVQVLIPGVKKDNIEAVYEDGWLSIKGKVEVNEDENDISHYSETFKGEFERKIRIKTAVQNDSAKAKYENGILSLNFKKVEKELPKQIDIL